MKDSTNRGLWMCAFLVVVCTFPFNLLVHSTILKEPAEFDTLSIPSSSEFPVFRAADFDGQSGVQVSRDGRVESFDPGDHFYFDNVDLSRAKGIKLSLATVRTGAYFSVHLDEPDGKLIGFFDLTKTGGWAPTQETEQQFKFKPVRGTHRLYFVGGSAGDAATNIAKISTFQLTSN